MARTYKRDSNGRFAGGGGGGGGRAGKAGGKPKTTTARGRARSAEASARAKVKAGGGAKAARSLFTAQRARDFYKATGSGTKRSVAKGAAKAPAKGAAKVLAGGGKSAKSSLWKGREGQAVRTANRVAAKINASSGSKDRSARAQVSAATARRAADYLRQKATAGKEPASRRGGLTSNANLTTMRAAQSRMARKNNPARPAKMSKAAPNTAKQKYKAAASKVRELKMYRGGRTDATVKKAQATVKRMERSRRSSRARV